MRRPNAERIALLSYAYWSHCYAANPNALNTLIRLDERPYRIVGVMPQALVFPFTAISPGEPPALCVPLSFSPDEQSDWASSFDTAIIARRRTGTHFLKPRTMSNESQHSFRRNTLTSTPEIPSSTPQPNPGFRTSTPAFLDSYECSPSQSLWCS